VFAVLARGGVALTAAFAVSSVLIDAANAMERIGDRTEDAFGKMAKGAKEFDQALTLKGLQELLDAEDDTARIANLWEDIGDEIQISMSGAKIDIEDFDRAMGKLKDTSATLAYQVLDDLEASIGKTFGIQGVENANKVREAVVRWRKEIDQSVETQARLAAAREDDEELMREQARALGLLEGETAELTEEQQDQVDALEKLGESLRNLNREYELAGGAIEAFESAAEKFNDTLYAQDEAQIEALDSFAALNEQIKENGKSLDIATKEGRDNKKAVIDLGKAIRDDLVQAYKDSDGSLEAVTERAGYWNDVLKLQQQELGLTDEEVREYQKTLGLTPSQVETLIKLNGQEEARIQLDLLNLDLDEIDDRVVVAKIQQQILAGDYIGARNEIQRYYDRNPVTLRIRAEGLGQMNAWLQGNNGRPTGRVAAPSGEATTGTPSALRSTGDVPLPGSTMDVTVPVRQSRGGTNVTINMPPGVDEWKVMSAIERYRRRNG
jgi:phosphotransferase system HPr-like phosphotransfer protein